REPLGLGSDLHARRAQDPDGVPRHRRVVGGTCGAAAGHRLRRGGRARAARSLRVGGLEAPALASFAQPTSAACAGTGRTPSVGRVSAVAEEERADRVAGFLCAFSFTLSGIAVARSPALLATAAIIVALVATRMTTKHGTLAAVAVAVGACAFVLGMVVAVLTDSGLY